CCRADELFGRDRWNGNCREWRSVRNVPNERLALLVRQTLCHGRGVPASTNGLTNSSSIIVESIMGLVADRTSTRNRAGMKSSEQLILAVTAGCDRRLERRRGMPERRAVGRDERASSDDLLRAGAPTPALQGRKPLSRSSAVVAPTAIGPLPPDNEMW